MSRQASSFDEVSTSDHYRKTQTSRPVPESMRGSTFKHRAEGLEYSQDNQEFSRASIDSAKDGRCPSEDHKPVRRKRRSHEKEENERGDDYSRDLRQYPDHFRGTGQNGQILKEDMISWSRRLHYKRPPNIYHRVKIPHKTIMSVSTAGLLQLKGIVLTVLSVVVLCFSLNQSYRLLSHTKLD